MMWMETRQIGDDKQNRQLVEGQMNANEWICMDMKMYLWIRSEWTQACIGKWVEKQIYGLMDTCMSEWMVIIRLSNKVT